QIWFSTVTNSVIAGNYIGANAAGTGAIGTGWIGVNLANSSGITIGTNGDGQDDAAERNVIAGNWGGIGINLTSVTNSVIAGNYVGVDASGTHALGTAGVVVLVQTSSSIRIGTNGDGVSDSAERNILGASNGAVI